MIQLVLLIINSFFLNEDYVMRESQIGMCVHVILYLPSEARPPHSLTCFLDKKFKSFFEYIHLSSVKLGERN